MQVNICKYTLEELSQGLGRCGIASGQKPHKTDTLIDCEYASECDEDYAEEKSIPPNGRQERIKSTDNIM